jgi:predicted methyltransferase
MHGRMADLNQQSQRRPRTIPLFSRLSAFRRARLSSAAGLLWLLQAACQSEVPPATPAPVVTATAPKPVEPKPPAPDVQRAVLDAVNAADRAEADRELDAGRQPQRLLTFFGVGPGMRVAEIAAGGGYTAELLARVVGPSGVVYGQNSKFILERFAEGPWSERLRKPVMNNVKRVDSEFDNPLPAEATNLDVVTIILFYHDTVWQKTDRPTMNRIIFQSLKSGGVYGVVDHSARVGAGLNDVETLHRIEESVLIAEIEKAGFVLEESADFLRNPDDPRDWNASPREAGERRGSSDRFVLKFRKP